jgi:hypothetical protein
MFAGRAAGVKLIVPAVPPEDVVVLEPVVVALPPVVVPAVPPPPQPRTTTRAMSEIALAGSHSPERLNMNASFGWRRAKSPCL